MTDPTTFTLCFFSRPGQPFRFRYTEEEENCDLERKKDQIHPLTAFDPNSAHAARNPLSTPVKKPHFRRHGPNTR